MISSSRLSSVAGTLVFVSGLGGFGKIWVLGRTYGSGLTLFLLLPFWWLRIRLLKLLRFWLSLISLTLSSAKPGCLFFL